MLVIGEKEVETEAVSVRKQGDGDQGTMTKEEFVELINIEVKNQLSGLYN